MNDRDETHFEFQQRVEIEELRAVNAELVEALETACDAIDLLLARIIMAAPPGADPVTYHPSKSGLPWTALIQSRGALARAQGKKVEA